MDVEANRPEGQEIESPLSQFIHRYTRLVDISPRLHVSRTQLIEWITKLPVLDSLVALSRVDALLYSSDFLDPGLQQRLVAELFRNDDLGPLLMSYIEEHPSTVLFHPHQVYLTMSLLLGHGSTDGALPLNLLLSRLGRVLLAVNEHCDPPDHLWLPRLSRKGRIIGTIWQTGQLYNVINVKLGPELARAYAIYTQSNEFNRQIETIFGADPLAFWSVAFAVVGQVLLHSKDFLSEGMLLDRARYFSTIDPARQPQVDRVLELLSSDLPSLRESRQRHLRRHGYEEFNFEFIREKPLLRVDERHYVCLSRPFLVWRVTRGLPDLIRMTVGSEQYQPASQSLASVFESYVRDRLREAYRVQESRDRVIHRAPQGRELGDALIYREGQLGIVEVKAASIRKEYRWSDNIARIRRGLSWLLAAEGETDEDGHSLAVGAIWQTIKCAKMILRGQVSVPEIEPARVRAVYPIVVSCQEHVPVFPLLTQMYWEVSERAKARYDLVRGYRVAPVEILDIRELEVLAELVRHGQDLLNIVRRKQESRYSDQSMMNYLFATGLYRNAGLPENLNVKLEELMDVIPKRLGLRPPDNTQEGAV